VALKRYIKGDFPQAGCDEAGRGSLAGPVFAAAVILPRNFHHPLIDDSKKMTAETREEARSIIEDKAISWAVAMVDHLAIDIINILNASIKAMHLAIEQLHIEPKLLLIDGNRFHTYQNIQHKCIIGGDGIYASIAAASILAKVYRDRFMVKLHNEFPEYGWDRNKAYATPEHREAIQLHGICHFHRRSFTLKPEQLELELEPEEA
jgi:ribonuclease HII